MRVKFCKMRVRIRMNLGWVRRRWGGWWGWSEDEIVSLCIHVIDCIFISYIYTYMYIYICYRCQPTWWRLLSANSNTGMDNNLHIFLYFLYIGASDEHLHVYKYEIYNFEYIFFSYWLLEYKLNIWTGPISTLLKRKKSFWMKCQYRVKRWKMIHFSK